MCMISFKAYWCSYGAYLRERQISLPRMAKAEQRGTTIFLESKQQRSKRDYCRCQLVAFLSAEHLSFVVRVLNIFRRLADTYIKGSLKRALVLNQINFEKDWTSITWDEGAGTLS